MFCLPILCCTFGTVTLLDSMNEVGSYGRWNHFNPAAQELSRRISGISKRILKETANWIQKHPKKLCERDISKLRKQMRKICHHLSGAEFDWAIYGIPRYNVGRVSKKDSILNDEDHLVLNSGTIPHAVSEILSKIPEATLKFYKKTSCFGTSYKLHVSYSWNEFREARRIGWEIENLIQGLI